MKADLVIIGAGIAGLTAALKAEKYGLERVLLLDHQNGIGGFTRLYMENDEFMEERKLLSRSAWLPYKVKSKATVVGFFPGDDSEPHQLYVQTPDGTESLKAKRILIATGSLEKPREAHKIAGPRPAGIMTPSLALELLNRGYVLGEHVAVYNNGRQSRSALAAIGRSHDRVTILDGTTTDIVRIRGNARLEGVSVTDRQSGETRDIPCDTLVYAKGRYPSTFFLKGAPVERDEHQAIRVDSEGRTNVPGVFAAGSCTCLGDDDHLRSIQLAERAAHALLQSL